MNKFTVWSHADFVTLDPSRPRAAALVTEGEEIRYVGDELGARSFAGPEARIEDLNGRTVIPGFNDNHLHLVIFGDHTYAPDLSGLDETAIVAKVKTFSETTRQNSLLVAYAWDYPSCPHPRKELLDAAFPDRPVFLAQFGGHGAWVNSVVLKAMGIDRYHAPKTGQVLRDESGEPTGILREMGETPFMQKHFQSLFFKKLLREPRIRRSLDEFRRVGITSIQDNTWFHPVLSTLHRLYRRRELTARVSCWSFGRVPSSLPFMKLGPYHGEWVHAGPRKYFLD